ncbi:MAG: energy transducer TonB [Flavobacteriales bacterium]|nr:energy transducer TonB [Flavobacteriales bacterium]
MEYLIFIGVLLVLSIAMAMDLSWNNVLTAARNEMVFADRNQDYGAFVLRRDYTKRLLIAVVGSVLVFGLAVGLPKIIASLSGDGEVVEAKKIVDVNLDIFEQEKKEEPPPPPPVEPPPPVKIESVQFTQLVAKDEPVEEPPPTQETLQETTAGTTTQEGEKGDEPPPPPVEEEPQIFTIVEEMPSFPGGEAALFKFLEKTMKYPPMAIDAGIKGVVYVTFVVDEKGKVREPKVLRGIGGGCDEEAIRVVKSMPDWEPGKQRGKPVRVQYNMPIRFTLR